MSTKSSKTAAEVMDALAEESKTVAENRLVGEYLASRYAAGYAQVSLAELETVRVGIRLALG